MAIIGTGDFVYQFALICPGWWLGGSCWREVGTLVIGGMLDTHEKNSIVNSSISIKMFLKYHRLSM